MDEVVEFGEDEGFFHFDCSVNCVRRKCILIFYGDWVEIRWEQPIYSLYRLRARPGS